MRDAEVLLKQIMKPLCETIRAGRDGDMLKLQVCAQNLECVLDVLGWHKEAKLVQKSCT